MCLLHPLGMESDQTWKHLGALTNRIACRLTAVREGKIFAGDAERPVSDEEGAATGTYTPAAACDRRGVAADHGGDGSGGGIRTRDLLVMSQASYCCSTPHKTQTTAVIPDRAAGRAIEPHVLGAARFPSCGP